MIILPLLTILLQGQAALVGRTICTGTETPVAHARILLTKVGGRIADSITAAAGDDGTFNVPNIPPGTYRVFAVHDDFVRAEMGQTRAGQPGSPVTLGPGQKLNDVRLMMTPTGVISGRVVDEFNDSVSKV